MSSPFYSPRHVEHRRCLSYLPRLGSLSCRRVLLIVTRHSLCSPGIVSRAVPSCPAFLRCVFDPRRCKVLPFRGFPLPLPSEVSHARDFFIWNERSFPGSPVARCHLFLVIDFLSGENRESLMAFYLLSLRV